MDSERRKLGGVKPNEINALWQEEGGPPTIANSSILERFIRGVSALVQKRQGGGEEGSLSIFILCEEDVLQNHSALRDTPDPFLRHGNTPICDQIWASSASLGNARRFAANNQTSYSDSNTALNAIKAQGLGKHPTIVTDWRNGQLMGIIFTGGISNPDTEEPFYIGSEMIQPEDLKRELDRFHSQSTISPALGKGEAPVWKNASTFIPVPKVETTIQTRIVGFLKGTFSSHDVRGEENNDAGRVDIQISRKIPAIDGSISRSTDWVLELKALSEKTYTGTPKKAAEHNSALKEGLGQAIEYRKKIPANHSALCCYDMRKKNIDDSEVFKQIDQSAKDKKVHLWRWYLYNSASAARAAALSAAE